MKKMRKRQKERRVGAEIEKSDEEVKVKNAQEIPSCLAGMYTVIPVSLCFQGKHPPLPYTMVFKQPQVSL
jgi:hypothetical protein